MNKKTLNIVLVVVALAVIGGLSYMIFNQEGNRNTTLADKNMVDFAISDTASIDKIILRPYNGAPYTLTRATTGEWLGEKGTCIQQAPVNNILDAIKNVRIKGFPTDQAQDNIKNDMTLNGVRVEIFQNGKESKTWIVGSSTADHYGCYMLLEKNKKQSPKAVITEMMGFNGTLNVRFYANPLQWACTNLFAYSPNDIKKVEIINNENSKYSFEVEVLGANQFNATKQGQNVRFDTNEVRDYIILYKKIHFENQTVELDELQKDSLRKSTPFSQIKITTNDGDTRVVNCYKKRPYEGNKYDLEGNLLEFDREKFWIDLGNNEFARCQYFVFDKLFKGYRPIFNQYNL